MGLSGKDELFTRQSQLLTTLRKKALENTEGKGENAGNQHFFLFPQCFLPYRGREIIILTFLIYFVVCKCFQFGQG